jgi:hypothetical protein
MGPWSVPHRDIRNSIRAVAYSGAPRGIFGRMSLSFPSTPHMTGDQVPRLRTRTLLWSVEELDLSRLRTFGCRLYISRPPRPRRRKSEMDTANILLSYAHTLKEFPVLI